MISAWQTRQCQMCPVTYNAVPVCDSLVSDRHVLWLLAHKTASSGGGNMCQQQICMRTYGPLQLACATDGSLLGTRHSNAGGHHGRRTIAAGKGARKSGPQTTSNCAQHSSSNARPGSVVPLPIWSCRSSSTRGLRESPTAEPGVAGCVTFVASSFIAVVSEAADWLTFSLRVSFISCPMSFSARARTYRPVARGLAVVRAKR